MKALLKTKEGSGYIEFIDMPVPEPDYNEILIRVHAVGVCGTDIRIWRGTAWSNPPVILGHEISGVIEKVGKNVKNLCPGQRVVTETAQIICGHCFYCRTGNYLMCPERLSIGYGTDGGMAQFIKVRADIVHPISETIGLDAAALCEPAAVAVHAVYDTERIKSTDTVVVTGCGAVGILVAQVAKSLGALVILTGIDRDTERLNIAREIGIEHTVNTDKEDVSAVVNSLTSGMGADIVYECSGTEKAVRLGMSILKRKGTLVQVGLTNKNCNIEYSLLTAREIKLSGSFGHRWESWDTALKLIENGKIKAEPLISNRFPIEEWEKAFEYAESGKGLKTLIYPNQEM